jgi:hypothetical protein
MKDQVFINAPGWDHCGGARRPPLPQARVPSYSLYAGGASHCEVANGAAAARLPWSQPSFALAINNYWLLLRRPANNKAHFSSVTFPAEATRWKCN